MLLYCQFLIFAVYYNLSITIIKKQMIFFSPNARHPENSQSSRQSQACLTRKIATTVLRSCGFHVWLVFLIVSLLFSTASFADDSLIEGAKLCTQYLPRSERQNAIPSQLLAAIASTESGRYHRELGLNLPWPWTINVEGKGYFFDTKAEAIKAVQNFQSRGIQSIDVGCMQVNLHHHPEAFANLEQAFDPAYNVAYAAQFLKNNFTQEGSWRKAAADYHSHTALYGNPYANMVFGAWSKIINKVADARAGRPVLQAVADKSEPPVLNHKTTGLAAATPKYHATHMHSISVSSESTTKENGVLVVRGNTDAVNTHENEKRDEFVSAKTPPKEENGAKIIKVAKGQFQPRVKVNNENADSAAKISSQNSAFVFDN